MGDYGQLASVMISGAGQANAQVQAGRMNRSTENQNAALATLSAQDAIERGDLAAGEQVLKARQVAGAARAAAGAGGIGVTAGSSASEAINDTLTAEQQNIRQIRANAVREAFGFRVERDSHLMRGRLDMLGATNEALGTLATTGYKATELYKRLRPAPGAPASTLSPAEQELADQRANGWEATTLRDR